MADPYDPHHHTPLLVGERVRIAKAWRSGSDLQAWERHLAGRTGTVRAWRMDADGCRAEVALDPLKPKQRQTHVVSLCLWSAWHPGRDLVERLPAAAGEEVAHG